VIDLPKVIAHRGASAQAPENTLAAFARARELGCTWVEFDVRVTRDDVPVVIHDATLARTTDSDRAVDEIHSLALAEIDAGSWFDAHFVHERVPTLAQALDACVVLGLTPNIEIKADRGGRMAIAAEVARVVKERWPAGRPGPLVSSYSLRALYRVRFSSGSIPLGLLMWGQPRRFWRLHARILMAACIHVDPAMATGRFVERVHRSGRKIAVYTVDSIEQARDLFARGVDTIFSNQPEALIEPSGADVA